MQKVKRFVLALVLLAVVVIPTNQALALGNHSVGESILQRIWTEVVLFLSVSAPETTGQSPENGHSMDPDGSSSENGLTMDPDG